MRCAVHCAVSLRLQTSAAGHSSVEDAVTALALAQLKVRHNLMVMGAVTMLRRPWYLCATLLIGKHVLCCLFTMCNGDIVSPLTSA
jgi:hypothetical protein